MHVHFKEVGRDKMTWTKDFGAEVNEEAIAKEAKRGAGLMSSDVEAEIHESGHHGEIYVGGFRLVGTFTIS